MFTVSKWFHISKQKLHLIFSTKRQPKIVKIFCSKSKIIILNCRTLNKMFFSWHYPFKAFCAISRLCLGKVKWSSNISFGSLWIKNLAPWNVFKNPLLLPLHLREFYGVKKGSFVGPFSNHFFNQKVCLPHAWSHDFSSSLCGYNHEIYVVDLRRNPVVLQTGIIKI